ncbi:MAG: GT4 family glycosyltransferase PelF [Caldilineaceae bacterium]
MTNIALNPTERRLSVLMVTEGNYPYHWGGVSTWCHLLLSDLPHIDFKLISLMGDPTLTPQFTLPASVSEFRPLPLWGVRELLENHAQLSMAELYIRKTKTTEQRIVRHFIPLFRAFLYELFADSGHPAHLGKLIHALHRFFLSYDFDEAMRSQATWRCFVQVVQTRFPHVAAQHGYANAQYSLADLTTCLQWLYHWFFPIGASLPKTDVVHAAMAGVCTLVATAAKFEHGAAYMLTEHGIYLRERYLAEAGTTGMLFRKIFSLRFARRMTELSYALADQISPCCDFNHRWELRLGAKREQIKTIYYGVDGSVFTPGGKPFGEPPVVVWVGRIDPLKDVLTLLRAAAIVYKARPDIQFRLFGNAPAGNEAYYEKCLHLHKELGLEEAVIFAGFRANAASAFNEGDIAVLTSVSEAFPFVVLEAMLCEKPVVATAVGGVTEQIEGCGFAVEPRNPEAVAEAILKLMGDPALCRQLGQAAREKAVREYGVRQSGLAHDNTYRRLVKQRNAARAAALTPTRSGLQGWLLQRSKPNRLLPETSGGQGGAYQLNGGIHGFQLAFATVAPPAHFGVATAGNGHNGEHSSRMRNGYGANGSQSASNGFTAPPHLRPANGNGEMTATEPLLDLLENAHGSPLYPNNEQPQVQAVCFVEAPRLNESALVELADEMAQRDAEPIDALEITAIIESIGVTDEVAQQRYGAMDTFALGAEVLTRMRANATPAQAQEPLTTVRPSLKEVLLNYGRGPLALLPPLLLLLMIFAYRGLGHWSAHKALVFSAGVTASMLVTNGFIQAMSRRACIYLGLRKPQAALRFLCLGSGVTLVCIGGLVGGAALLTTSLGLFTAADQQTFLLAFMGLTTLWVAASGLGLVEQAHWLPLSLGAGLVTGIMTDLLWSPLTPAHLTVATAVGYAFALFLILRALQRGLAAYQPDKPAPATRLRLPTFAYLLSEAAPYFGYGALYMVLILLPHLFGWFSGLGAGQTRAWAITAVEVGLTLSMPPLVLASGVAEHALRHFWQYAPTLQALTNGEQIACFGKTLRQFSQRHRNTYLLTLAGLSLVTHVAFTASVRLGLLTKWLGLLNFHQLTFIFDGGLLAYGLLGWGLFHCMFCVTLGRAQCALQAVQWGLLFLLLSGTPLLLFHYQYSVIAFVCGALAFALTAQRAANQVLRTSDYHFAASL